MLQHFIISLIAVLAFGIFEYTHNKASYDIKTAWVKYVVGLLLGTFGFSYLTKWEPFQWVEQAAFVVALLFFFWVIVQKLKIKGVPGQPLKIVALVVAVVGMSSCQQYGSAIVGNPYPGTDCAFRPVDAATSDSVAKGWLELDTLHAGNPLVCPVMVKIEASWKQKWEIARANGTEWVAFLLWGLAVVAIGLGIWQGNKGAGMVIVVGLFALAIILCWFGAGSIDWATTKEIEVTKALYDTPGALKAFWDANLLK